MLIEIIDEFDDGARLGPPDSDTFCFCMCL